MGIEGILVIVTVQLALVTVAIVQVGYRIVGALDRIGDAVEAVGGAMERPDPDAIDKGAFHQYLVHSVSPSGAAFDPADPMDESNKG